MLSEVSGLGLIGSCKQLLRCWVMTMDEKEGGIIPGARSFEARPGLRF